MIPEIKTLASWIEEKISSEKYGSLHITIKVHEGRILLEKYFVEKIQFSTGYSGGKSENRSKY